MSDGGKVAGKRYYQNNSVRSDANRFSQEISRVAVAQVCGGIGFEGFIESALDSLADIAIRYMCNLGKTSKFNANVAGRTECNVFDVIQGLVDLCMPLGLSGASEIRGDCVVSSGAITEIMDFVETSDEMPFAWPLPQFPVIREQNVIPSFSQMGEVPVFKHIPAWLPAFPDSHTYLQTPVWNERASDPRSDKIELARQHRKAESSLLSLQRRLVCNGSSVAEEDDGGDALEVGEMENPFLAKPFQNSEREMSSIIVPAKFSGEALTEKHFSLLETFSSAIEAMKDGPDSVTDGEKILPEKRPSVFLQFKSGKKVFCESLDTRIRNKSPGRPATWFGCEEENEKKRRVEFILQQSIENQHELP